MDCKLFNNKLEDYLNRKLPKDMESIMENHSDKCSNCKEIIDTEIAMKNVFPLYFNTDDIVHESQRNEIMMKVDKNKYRNNPLNKIKYAFLTNKGRCAATASILLAVILIVPFIKNLGLSSTKGAPKTAASTADSKSAENSALKAESTGISVNYYNIDKAAAGKMLSEMSNITKYAASPDNKRKALVYGKGQEIKDVTEEGYSKIILNDLAKNQYYIIELNDKANGITAKNIVWRNNSNLLVIIGQAYGTVTRGGDVYDLDLDSGELYLIYKTKDGKTEVTSVERGDEFHYILNINEYTDNNLIESKQYKENLTLK